MRIAGGNYCAAVACNNNYGSCPGLSFFRFPKDPVKCQRWLINTRRKDIIHLDSLSLYKTYRLCAKHFEDKMFMDPKKTKLIPKAFPTIFEIPIPHMQVACKETKRKLPKYHIEEADLSQSKRTRRHAKKEESKCKENLTKEE